MANVKISELPVATSVDVVDSVPLVQGGTTKQATQAALLTTTGNVTAAKLVPTGGTATGNGMYLPATNTLAWSTNGSERMRLDASGNLGIGVTNPAYTIDATAPSSGDTGIRLTKSGSVNTTINAVTGALTFGIDGSGGATERMRLDASGNLGLGVTPSAWSAAAKMQVPNGGAFGGAGPSLDFPSNAYFNAGWKYVDTGASALYSHTSGAHAWFTASSGTAGNAISFTQAMTLDASGNLAVGTTTTGLNDRMRVEGTEARIRSRNSTSGAEMYMGSMSPNEARLWTSTSTDLTFGTNNTERMRLDASGNLITTVNSAAPTLSANSTMSFELTSNTSLKIVVRGTDGVTRSVSLTLA